MPYKFLAECADKNCSDKLNMFNPEKSTGKLISYSGKLWVCFGSTHGDGKYIDCQLKEVIETRLYKGPPNNPNADPDNFYTGGTFKVKGHSYTMLEHEIELIPAIQLTLFEMEKQ